MTDEVIAGLKTDSNGNKYALNHDHGNAYKTNTLSPGNYNGAIHSHHGLQEKWASENLKDYGYDLDKAPTISLETNRGGVKDTPHSKISGAQITYNTQNGLYSGTLQDRLILGAQQELNAGIAKDVVLQNLENNYKMIDELNQLNEQKINDGKLDKLTYSSVDIEKSLDDNQQIKSSNC